MKRQTGVPKTCNRCGRTGSHAFRRTHDGLYECTTTTACRARLVRSAGPRHEGRGRLPRGRGAVGSAPGVAYVIGQESDERQLVEAALDEVTDLSVVAGTPSKATLAALGSRNVKLIAVAAAALESLAFRNEFGLRCRQPKLRDVPLFVFGANGAAAAAPRIATASTLQTGLGEAADMRRQLKAAAGGDWADANLTTS
ncbi:MAG TPA: hypothetical protein VHK63_00115 [Candidatus Limnocylindria bacterium]|nr:hypothetical protein [Candidatus Limnocylindria bacterium]